MTNDLPMVPVGTLPAWDPAQPSLDELDRLIVAALQVNGRATWQQISSVVEASESTVSRRANRLLRDGVVRVSAVPDPTRCGLGTPVLMQVTCAVGATRSVARAMAMRSDVRFVALLTGTYDLVLEVVVGSRAHLAEVLVDELRSVPGLSGTTTETIVRNFKTSYDWSRELLGDAARTIEPPPAKTLASVSLDVTDVQLVQILVEDGRTPVAELAGRLGLSESAVRRRIEHLTSNGALWFATFVDPQVMGYETELFLWLDVDFAKLDEIAGSLSALPEVRYISGTAGYSDLVCELVLRDLDHLYDFTTRVLGSMSGIRQVEMGQELQILKRGFLTSPAVYPAQTHYLSR